MIAAPSERTEKQQARVNRLRAVGLEVAETVELVESFAALIRKQSQTTLRAWHAKAVVGSSRELCRFAHGLKSDWEAVQAAVDEP